MNILEAENITAGYTTEVNILNDVDIRLKSGQIVSVIGPNGAGKSTLLKTIFGILKPVNGKIRLKDEDITGLKPDNFVGRHTAVGTANPKVLRGLLGSQCRKKIGVLLLYRSCPGPVSLENMF